MALKTCWDWCTEKHTHNYDRNRRQYAGYRLSKAEAERIYTQTGKRVETYDQYRRMLKEHGFRELEPGEAGDIQRRDTLEYDRAGITEAPPSHTPHRRNPVDIHQLFRETQSQ